MALMPPKYLQSVVALGIKSSPQLMAKTGEPMEAIATGFLYGYPRSGTRSDETEGFALWLVTCKHVIQDVFNAGHDEVLVRFNKASNAGMQTFRIILHSDEGPAWTLHQKADVAVIPASWPDLESKGVQWETFATGRNALLRESQFLARLQEGDEVYIAGFPIGWRTGRQDYPIVRHGVLAQIQGWLNHDHDTFLVDGSGFPGNSGGPVVTKPQAIAVAGHQIQWSTSWLVGMVSERRFSKIDTNKYAEIRIEVEETADLIEVVPMDAIDEAISLAMQRMRSDA